MNLESVSARQLAQDWFSAWNRHDLEAILAHYAEGVQFTSPFVVNLVGEPSGTIRGKTALRAYFAKALTTSPELHFRDLRVFFGVDSLTLFYRSVNNRQAAEVMTLDAEGRIHQVMAQYESAAAPSSRTDDLSTSARPTEWHRNDGYVLTDDPQRLDLDAVCALLQSTYWANDRPAEVIAKGIRHSTCLSLLHQGQLVGFIRGVTDQATFTWVCDVIVDSDHRGQGLGKWMMQCFLEHPALQTISHHLCTKDAHALYESFGFQRIEAMRRSDRPMPFLELAKPVSQ